MNAAFTAVAGAFTQVARKPAFSRRERLASRSQCREPMGNPTSSISRSPVPPPASRVAEPPRAPARATPPPAPTGHTGASTFEAGPAARVTDRTRLEGVLDRAGTDGRVRDRVLDRIDAMPEADQARERTLLERVATGPNGERAVRAYDEVSELAGSSRRARERLTPDVREALVRGVAEPRTPGDPNGEEGVMGVHQATTAARALVDMPADRYDAVTGALGRAGGGHAASPQADAQAERALILEAVAARAPALSRRGAAGDAALGEVTSFAGEIRGMQRDELMRTTSVIDTDSLLGTSARTDRTDGDGLLQRFTDSCAPTGAQIARAELDPIYARELHREGVVSLAADGAVGAEQERTLERGGGVAVSRRAARAHERFDDAISGETPEVQRRLRDYASGRLAARGDVEALMAVPGDLERVRAAHEGHPSVEELGLMRAEPRPDGDGMPAERALDAIARPAAHSRYTYREVGAHGLTERQADDMARRIEAGDDVGIRISDRTGDGGHFMMLTDVRGEGADRRFLVSDPWSGRTTWVSDADLRTPGTHTFDREFGVGWDRVTTYYYPRD